MLVPGAQIVIPYFHYIYFNCLEKLGLLFVLFRIFIAILDCCSFFFFLFIEFVTILLTFYILTTRHVGS